MAKDGNTVAIILAAGSGSRAGGNTPKQYRSFRGQPVLAHSYSAFDAHDQVDKIIVVIAAGHERQAKAALTGDTNPRLVIGGASRKQSVRNALAALHNDDQKPGRVLIHDAARPFLRGEVIDRLLDALETADGAVPVLPVVDTIAHEDTGLMAAIEPREMLRRVQTPQAFRFDALYAAHVAWPTDAEATDDAQMLMTTGGEVALVEGDEALQKLTFAEDFEMRQAAVRVGTGFDVHKLADGEQLWLCGVLIEHPQGLAGHSDADVAIHALVDAILGAVGAGDIGDHFPPSDPKWRGASSDQFLSCAGKIAQEAGYSIANADITIICEAPRLSHHRQAMRQRLSEILGVDIGALSVKATTTETLGFAGRGEGIAAQAVVCLAGN